MGRRGYKFVNYYLSTAAGGGDINGDGIDDFVIGAAQYWLRGSRMGSAWVVFGQANRTSDVVLDSVTRKEGFSVRTTIADHHLGSDVAIAGEMNGDALADVAVASGSIGPRIYVIWGRR